METGCIDCPEGHWSENDDDVACTPCPGGKTVGSGLGKGESDCALSEFIFMVCILYSSPLYLIWSWRPPDPAGQHQLSNTGLKKMYIEYNNRVLIL